MALEQNDLSLAGKLLIAMPSLGDPRFDKSVIFMCAHSDEGAMGLVINKPATEVSFPDLMSQLSIKLMADVPMPMVHVGGPMEHGRGFVLHSRDYGQNPATLKVAEGFGMTATLDVLEDIAQGKGPDDCLLALGYAGWAPGQLEGELQQNTWLVTDAERALVFDGDSSRKWAAALGSMGIDPLNLSAEGGRA